MLAYLVQSCVTRSYSWFGCYFLCFDLLLLTLSITKTLSARSGLIACDIVLLWSLSYIFHLQSNDGSFQAYLFCKALVQSTKCYSLSLSLSNHAPFNLFETRQKRLRHVNVIFSPRVVKTPVQDQKFGTNSLDKIVYEIMQIEVHVRASWQSSEGRLHKAL